jgi:hypothetical protein
MGFWGTIGAAIGLRRPLVVSTVTGGPSAWPALKRFFRNLISWLPFQFFNLGPNRVTTTRFVFALDLDGDGVTIGFPSGSTLPRC